MPRLHLSCSSRWPSYNPDGVLVAVLATRIPTIANGGIPEDRTRITWNLREGAAWSDGTPLTANDVVFTWKYCTAPGGGCAQATRFENVAAVEAVDERTVTVVFNGPVSFPYSPFVSYVSPILPGIAVWRVPGRGGYRMH